MRTNLLISSLVLLLMSCSPLFAADQVLTDKTTGMKLVLVKGGCFQMGDSLGDGDKDEKPVHEACVSDFYIGKFEVTQSQWQKVMGTNPSAFKECGTDCPVETFNGDMLQDFLKKLNAASGSKYRLPTEAEWEYAARSGGKNEKWAGTNEEAKLDDFAWHEKNSNGTTHPVGQKKPNGLGLYDMTGNVREWCQDWYNADFYITSPRDNPVSSKTALERVQRGGSWDDDYNRSRSASRRHNLPDPSSTYGLRLVLPLH